MAAGQGAGDCKALTDLSVIFRDGIGVTADTDESLRWAAVVNLMNNIGTAAETLQRLGYPRGFTGVVLPNSSGGSAAITDNTPLVNDALLASLRAPPGSQQQSPSLPLLFRCCCPSSVSFPLSRPNHLLLHCACNHTRAGHCDVCCSTPAINCNCNCHFDTPPMVELASASLPWRVPLSRPILHTKLLIQACAASNRSVH
jgi:hypothetical protein